MKILSLNCWGARIRPEIYSLLEKYRDEVDVFCFQEAFNDPLDKRSASIFSGDPDIEMCQNISWLLPEHQLFFAPCIYNAFGMAIFVRRSLSCRYDEHQVAGPDADSFKTWGEGDCARKIQILSLEGLSIVNFHGLWIPGSDKGDAPERLKQSERIGGILDTLQVPFVLIGDFNMDPDTESLAILAEWRRNLIKEYGISWTRTHWYQKTTSPFADYAIVSNNINVSDFQVLSEVVSDHAPLLLTIL